MTDNVNMLVGQNVQVEPGSSVVPGAKLVQSHFRQWITYHLKTLK